MNGKSKISWKSMILLLLALALSIGVSPASPASAREDLSVDIGKTARLIEDGQAVELKVKVRCAIEGFEVLEAFVYVVQDGNQSNFAGLPVTCDGRPNMQVFTVRVTALDFLFHQGEATASAFILLLDPVTQDTISTGDSETIRIR